MFMNCERMDMDTLEKEGMEASIHFKMRYSYEKLKKIAHSMYMQNWGFSHNWAGVGKNCKKHGLYMTGGNWDTKECPYCAWEEFNWKELKREY